MRVFPFITTARFKQLPREKKIRYAQLLKEEIEYREAHPLEFFVPNRPQLDLILAVSFALQGKSPKRRFVQTCSNRQGKSTASMALLAALCTMFRQGAFSQIPRRWPYSKKIWIVANKDNVKENLLDIFDFYINGSNYAVTKDGKNHNSHYVFKDTKFEVFVKTYGQQDDTFESTTVGGLWFDEPPKESIWDACKSRLMQGGLLVMGATPLFGGGYLYDQAVLKAKGNPKSIYWHKEAAIYENIKDSGFWFLTKAGKLRFIRPNEKTKIKRLYEVKDKITWGKLPGNWKRTELKKLGFDDQAIEMLYQENIGKLPLAEIAAAIEEFDDESYEARVFGRFKFLSGAVYKKWPEYKSRIFIKLPPKNHALPYVHRMIIDPHDRRPPAVCWFRVDQYMNHYLIREWPSEQDEAYGYRMFHNIPSSEPWILRDWVKMWIKIEKELGITNTPNNPIKVIMDPNFGNKPNSVTGKAIFQEYQDEFRKQGSSRVINTSVFDDLTAGHESVRRMLKPTGHGEHKFFVDDRCTNIDYGMRNYMYQEHTGKSAEDKAPKEQVRDKYKDFPDLIRYHFMAPLHFPELKKVDRPGTYHDLTKNSEISKSMSRKAQLNEMNRIIETMDRP